MLREVSLFLYMEFKRALAYKISTLRFICGLFIRVLILLLISSLWGREYTFYILLPLIPSIFFSRALISFYRVIQGDYWSGRIELFFNLPLKFLSYIFYKSLASYVWAFLQSLVYIVVILCLNPPLDYRGFPIAFIGVCLCWVACLGMGLVSASMFFYLKAKGGGEPISYLVTLLVELASGLYYPLKILPTFLQFIGLLLPQTYAFDLIRRTVLHLNDFAFPISFVNPVFLDLFFLVNYAVMWFLLGYYCFKRSLEYARSYGLPVR